MMVVWRTILAINVLINVCARLVEAAPTLQTLAATGTRACLDRRSDDYRCTGRSSCEILDLSSCSFTDADICEVETCFKEASGANSIINTINIEDNDFTMSGENLIRSMLTPSGRRSASMPVCGDPTTATEIDVGHAPWEEEEDWPVDFWGPETLADRQARGQARELGSSKHAEITVGVVGKDYDMQHNLGEEDEERAESGETAVITPVWDSTDCLAHWGRPELIDSPDPDGYIIFVNGRWDQLPTEACFDKSTAAHVGKHISDWRGPSSEELPDFDVAQCSFERSLTTAFAPTHATVEVRLQFSGPLT
ncbi:unnamed protein product [Laminaria digitata]